MFQLDTDRVQPLSYRKHSILMQMQDNFRRIDPTFQIRYYIKENSHLMVQHKNRLTNRSNERNPQIGKLINSLHFPQKQTSFSQNQKTSFFEQTSTVEIVPAPITPKQYSPLKGLFQKYKNLVQDNYQNSSPEMQKIIDAYTIEKQRKKKVNKLNRIHREYTFYSPLDDSIQQTSCTAHIQDLINLQNELINHKHMLGKMKRLRNKMKIPKKLKDNSINI